MRKVLQKVKLTRESLRIFKNLIYKVTCCVCAWPLDAEKSAGGCREKWREKDKTTVGWRGPETQVLRVKYRGPETQVLRVKPSVRLSRSWNPGPESQMQQRGLAGTDELCPTVKGTH
jgi:hypothetical protein